MVVPRPVDASTELAMQGIMNLETGLARIRTAHNAPQVQAAAIQAAQQNAMMAAENIRNRYYKKEFEQILDTRVRPLIAQLQQAQDDFRTKMQTSVIPVRSTLGPGEAQDIGETYQGGGQVTSSTGPDGSQAVQTAEVAAPNVALQPGMIGAMAVRDELSLIDPNTGEAVPLSSPHGLSLWNNAKSEFWTTFSNVNQQLMDVMGEYSGNPYAGEYMRGVMDNVIKQGNLATTGIADPIEAQQKWQDRLEWEADLETKQQERITGLLALQTEEANLNVAVNDAARLVETDAAFVDLVGKNIAGKLIEGQPLTRPEMLQASSAVNVHRRLQEKQIAQRARQRLFTIPQINVNNPENWEADIQADPVFDTYKNQFFNQALSLALPDLRAQAQNDPEGFASEMRAMGVPETDIQTFIAGGGATPAVVDVLKANMTAEQTQSAYDIAFLKRLPELERQQPELSPVIDDVVEEAVGELKSRYPNMTPEQEDVFRQDRYRTFFEWSTGREAPQYHDPMTLQRVAEAKRYEQMIRSAKAEEFPEEVEVPAPIDIPEPAPVDILVPRAQINLRDLASEVMTNPDAINELSQEQLAEGLKQINWILVGHRAGKIGSNEERQLRNLQTLMRNAYETPIEKALDVLGGAARTVGEKVTDWFTTSEEEKQQIEQKRQRAWILE